MKTMFLILAFLNFSGFTYPIEDDHSIVYKKDLKWVAAPAGLPKGAEIAVLNGDPTKEGEFTMRVRIPANYTVKPHFHPGEEHLTVLEGELHLGLGEKIDQKELKTLGHDDFVVMSPGTKHYVHTQAPVVIQVHGVGPWGITYVNEADDPRR
jgi:quercetin dioxygenase-like cupin family protein